MVTTETYTPRLMVADRPDEDPPVSAIAELDYVERCERENEEFYAWLKSFGDVND